MDRGMILTDELNEQSTTDEKRGAVVGQFPASKRDFNHDNLPIEDPSLFSEDPISFEEMTAYLFEDVERNYNFSKILNRFSDHYLDVSHSVEKGIGKLASCCLTKTVLEQKGYQFPYLQGLCIDELYRMVSFNYRKCHAAITETTEDLGIRI